MNLITQGNNKLFESNAPKAERHFQGHDRVAKWVKKNIRPKKDTQRLIKPQSGINIKQPHAITRDKVCPEDMRIQIRKMAQNFILITVIEFGGLNYQQI